MGDALSLHNDSGGTIGISSRELLRRATADLHARIDASLSGQFDTDTPAYTDFLMALARAILPLEDALEKAGVHRLLPDWRERRRSKELQHDLARLGMRVPPLAPIPSIDSAAWQFGALYVLEGSRLGGKFLLRRVLANSDAVVREATRYLKHGADRPLWPTFVQRLESSPDVKQAPADAVAGARAAFTLFEAC